MHGGAHTLTSLVLAGVLGSRFIAASNQPRSQCVCNIRVHGACSAFPGIAEIGWFDDSTKGGPIVSCCEASVCRERAAGWASDCSDDATVEHSFGGALGGTLTSPLYDPERSKRGKSNATLRNLNTRQEKESIRSFSYRCDGADRSCAQALAILESEYISTAFPALLEFGGFVCYAFTKLLTGSKLIRGLSDDINQRALRHLCARSSPESGHNHTAAQRRRRLTIDGAQREAAERSPTTSILVLQHHNGLGNQLFENLFGELLARDLGYRLVRTTDTLVPVCGKETADMHTEVGFRAFQRLRPNDGSAPADDYRGVCSRHHITLSFERPNVERAIFAEAIAEDCEGSLCNAQNNIEMNHILVRDLIKYVTSDIAGPRCVLLAGYFQDLAMYGDASAVQTVLSKFVFSHPSTPSAQTLVHLRHEPKDMEPFKQFYRKHLGQLNGSVQIITDHQKLEHHSKMIAFLQDAFGAQLYHGARRRREWRELDSKNFNPKVKFNPKAVDSLLDDFQVMIFADNLVPFPTSTLSLWACIFSLAQRAREKYEDQATSPSFSLCSLRTRIR